MSEVLKILVIAIPASLLLAIGWVYLIGNAWSKGRIIIADIIAFFGWAGKRVRKLSVEQEYQGTINGIIQNYNKNFKDPILPNCKIEWVTSENQRNILKENEAIICLSFDRKDHNLNFYNATLNFVQTALIAKAKNYLIKSSAIAIDLLTTHIILRNNRREVLSTFRLKLNEFSLETRNEFENLIPTNERGLFLNLLLPEFHFYGELIDTLPPNEEYRIEANNFFSWFKELATREFDERTNLKFLSKNFKVGVILVAKEETWETQGPPAYIKWADYYASENFNSVYILARGSHGYERATEITKILTNSKGYDQINKDPRIKCVAVDGKEYIVTCYSLRPNKATIAYLAWERFKEFYSEGKEVPGIIDSVNREKIIITAFGLKLEISNNQLSEIEINDARKVFKPEDEIYLKIIEFNPDNQHIILSNVGTKSDPKNYINAVLETDRVYDCIVEKTQTDKHGLQTGLKVSTPELKSWIYVPKFKATPSRFLDLEVKYPSKSQIRVIIERYNSALSNFDGIIENLKDPWDSETLRRLQVGNQLDVIVKQINEFSIICEIEEGLECILARHEISWERKECITSVYKVDDSIKVQVILIDTDRRKIDVSLKRLTKTPELEYFENNINQTVELEIEKVIPDKGISVKYPGGTNTGFIHWFEIGWGSVGRFELIFKSGDRLRAVVTEFDTERNNLKFSIKRQFPHDFQKWYSVFNEDEPVRGKVIRYFENSVQIEIVNNGLKVQAYILKKNISNIAFIDSDDLPFYMPIGQYFHFYVLEINQDRMTISLTRKEYLEDFESPEYGEVTSVSFVKESYSKGFFYSDDLEGWIALTTQSLPLGSTIDVIPVSQSNNEFGIA